MTGPRVRLGIVIPAHNEAKTISGVVQAALPVAKAYGGRVIVVAHNCADDTAQLAAAAGAEVIVLNEGHGKSAAVAAGVAALDVEIIGLLDADCRGITWKHVLSLALPVLEGEAMMAVGCFDYSTWNPITQAVLGEHLGEQPGARRDELGDLDVGGAEFGARVAGLPGGEGCVVGAMALSKRVDAVPSDHPARCRAPAQLTRPENARRLQILLGHH